MVVLPLILLFVIYAFVLIRTIVIAKLENQRKVQAQQVVTVDSLSDEEKRRLAQEYLASLQMQADNDGSESADVTEHDDSLALHSDADVADLSDGASGEDHDQKE